MFSSVFSDQNFPIVFSISMQFSLKNFFSLRIEKFSQIFPLKNFFFELIEKGHVSGLFVIPLCEV
jgi:hypothetical protein